MLEKGKSKLFLARFIATFPPEICLFAFENRKRHKPGNLLATSLISRRISAVPCQTQQIQLRVEVLQHVVRHASRVVDEVWDVRHSRLHAASVGRHLAFTLAVDFHSVH